MNSSKFILTAMVVVFSTFLMVADAFSSSEVYAGDIEKGKELAGATGCMGCHGADGNSPVPNFPKIAGLGSKYIYRQLQNVRDGNRIIASMAGLVDNYDDVQLKDLAVFYNSQTLQITGAKPLEVKVNAGIKVDSLKIGARVYRAGNLDTNVPSCIGCHSPRGLGNEPAGYPRLGGQYPEYIAKQLRAYRDGEREHEIMNTVAKNMTNAEIDSVANFIAGLN
ncbi:MAG: cytochrome c553 [Pseudohongiellaceae bacterium]|jgi:cytochrome c553